MNNSPWRLPQLLEASGIPVGSPVPDLPILQVTDDSRVAREGTLFVAVKGTQVDGHHFIRQVVEQGARVVMLEQDCGVPLPAVALKVAETQPLLGKLMHAFLGSPSSRLRLVGVTGTNGKTTVAWLVQHLLEKAGVRCGLLGTVCYRGGSIEQTSTNTTPGVVQLQTMLSQMVEEGLQACSMEVSSHALDQHRVAGLKWACGIFTNFGPEHLDYHETVENYFEAKLRLFHALGDQAAAVINRDDPVWERVADAAAGPVVTYGLRGQADLTAAEIQLALEGTRCRLRTPEGTFPVAWNLLGRHNLENLLAAVGAVRSLGVPVERCLEAIKDFQGVPGRLERIDGGQPFPVFVDYAHTDGALRSVLVQLLLITSKKILLVFGCGGDRDRTKRPRMGRVGAELSDRLIITSDNPRSEDPGAIAREVAAGTRGTPTPCGIVLDRREAIGLALESADEGWLVLIAGKGHETGQIIGDQVLPFDDRVVVRELLGNRGAAVISP